MNNFDAPKPSPSLDNLSVEKIEKKLLKRIKVEQARLLKEGSNERLGDTMNLTVNEAQYLLELIRKVQQIVGILDDNQS